MSVAHLHHPLKEIDGMSLYLDGEVAIIVMNRGENRINEEFLQAYDALLYEVEKLPNCKGLITTSTGKFFSNGFDLQWMMQMDESTQKDFLLRFKAMLKHLMLFPLPTLAAINGHCFAGGALLALGHDLRAMKNGRGWISLNEVWLGVVFMNYMLVFVRDKSGSGRNMSEGAVLGYRFTAQEALRNGLIHTVTPDSENLLVLESVRLLKSYYGKTGYPRESLALMKEAVYSKTLEAMNVDEESTFIQSFKPKL